MRIESLTHPQPGCLKLSGVTIAEQSFGDVFVVTSKDEVRVTVGSLVSGEDTARLIVGLVKRCLLYTSPSPRDRPLSRMPSSA